MNSARLRSLLATLVLALACSSLQAAARKLSAKPNILILLADDLGYGDLGCYTSQAKTPTPHLDRHAREGMRFTNAHSPANVCTPSRYSLMTGQMRAQHYGAERQESGEAKAERLVREELKKLRWKEADLAARRKGDPGKVRVARRLRQETTMTLAWITQGLQMGVRTHVSNLRGAMP